MLGVEVVRRWMTNTVPQPKKLIIFNLLVGGGSPQIESNAGLSWWRRTWAKRQNFPYNDSIKLSALFMWAMNSGYQQLKSTSSVGWLGDGIRRNLGELGRSGALLHQKKSAKGVQAFGGHASRGFPWGRLMTPWKGLYFGSSGQFAHETLESCYWTDFSFLDLVLFLPDHRSKQIKWLNDVLPVCRLCLEEKSWWKREQASTKNVSDVVKQPRSQTCPSSHANTVVENITSPSVFHSMVISAEI